jgi:hypothetical protein
VKVAREDRSVHRAYTDAESRAAVDASGDSAMFRRARIYGSSLDVVRRGTRTPMALRATSCSLALLERWAGSRLRVVRIWFEPSKGPWRSCPAECV